AAAQLDGVDHRDLGGVGELQGGSAHVEDGHLLAGVALYRQLLGGAEDVAVEGDRLLVVGRLDDQAHLQDPAGRGRLIHLVASPGGQRPVVSTVTGAERGGLRVGGGRGALGG